MTMLHERITVAVIYVYVRIQADLYIKLCHAAMQDLVMRLIHNITFQVSAEYTCQMSNGDNDHFEFISNLYHRIKKVSHLTIFKCYISLSSLKPP